MRRVVRGKFAMISDENVILTLFIIVGCLFLIVLVALFIRWLNDFQGELRYLNNEIKRTDGEEREYWLEKKRRLLLSIIPFIRYK